MSYNLKVSWKYEHSCLRLTWSSPSIPLSTKWATMFTFQKAIFPTNFNTKFYKIYCYIYIYICHTLATSLTSRQTRCCKFELICPLCTLYTPQCKTNHANPRNNNVASLYTHCRRKELFPLAYSCSFPKPVDKHSHCPPKQRFLWILSKRYLQNVSLPLF